jgi:hypothetical protein
MAYWTALQIASQAWGELGLTRLTTLTSASDEQAVQFLALLNSAGNELQLYYPWEQFLTELVVNTEIGKDAYDLPPDLAYFTDQTQWDRTNHWPLLGPKSAQEWAWLKGALVAALPRQRYRIMNDKLLLWPVPAAIVTMAMEYVSKNWVAKTLGGDETDLVTQDSDFVLYNPWLLVKFLKFKFIEQKNFPTKGVQADFLRIFNSITGKDTGGSILSLVPSVTSAYLGPWSVQDGSWQVGSGSG